MNIVRVKTLGGMSAMLKLVTWPTRVFITNTNGKLLHTAIAGEDIDKWVRPGIGMYAGVVTPKIIYVIEIPPGMLSTIHLVRRDDDSISEKFI